MKTESARAGFTLIELLVVITITLVLLGLIFGPVIQTFNMTRQANAMVMAQDTARSTLDQISREIGQAMFVYDNSNSPTNFPVQQPNGGAVVALQALYAKIDIIPPKLIMHCNSPTHPSDQPRDYERGDEAWPPCPTCNSTDVEARPKEPLAQESTVVRYFIGLADNTLPRDWQEDGPPENGFVLYRAEFDPYDETLVDRDPYEMPNLDDPNFFYGRRAAAWKAISRIVGPAKNVDLVTFRMNAAGDAILAVNPSVRFQLTQVTNDSFTPAYINDLASEAPGAIPTVFRASYGGWGSSVGPFTPDMFNVSVIRNSTWFRTGWAPTGHLMIFKYPGGAPVFDITNYMQTGSFAPDPKPEIAFTVDTGNGEVRFDFPASDVIDQREIGIMNQDVLASFGSGDPPSRERQMDMFMTIAASAAWRPRIVPGSEVVRGPDMTPGRAPDQIRMVRYERVPLNLGFPGRNQYKIECGYGLNYLSSVGVITFSPAYDEMIPEVMENGEPARIEITFKYQLNHEEDVVVGNYSTKTLMTIALGIRFYDSNSGKVHPVELTNKVRVRNLMR